MQTSTPSQSLLSAHGASMPPWPVLPPAEGMDASRFSLGFPGVLVCPPQHTSSQARPVMRVRQSRMRESRPLLPREASARKCSDLHALDLEELLETPLAVLAAGSGLLVAAEGR